MARRPEVQNFCCNLSYLGDSLALVTVSFPWKETSGHFWKIHRGLKAQKQVFLAKVLSVNWLPKKEKKKKAKQNKTTHSFNIINFKNQNGALSVFWTKEQERKNQRWTKSQGRTPPPFSFPLLSSHQATVTLISSLIFLSQDWIRTYLLKDLPYTAILPRAIFAQLNLLYEGKNVFEIVAFQALC